MYNEAMKQVTLLFLRKDDRILLAMKKRGFGVGLWNGIGGKVDPHETIAEAAIRECQEEIGVTPHDIKPAGFIQFFDPTDPTFEHHCYVFTAQSWEGEPRESEEMRPQWFATTDVPYDKMWPSDSLWLPHVIASELFQGVIHTSTDTVTQHDLKVVPLLQLPNQGGDNEPVSAE
jgi:8-oxo-dGTP pyrophosphatase MutT (NUDIX family)